MFPSPSSRAARLKRAPHRHAFRKNKIGMVLFAMGESGWKGALLARMIPFPYGLANAILSVRRLLSLCHTFVCPLNLTRVPLLQMTSISFYRYMVSTVVGLLPFQIMLVYFGTTIRCVQSLYARSIAER